MISDRTESRFAELSTYRGGFATGCRPGIAGVNNGLRVKVSFCWALQGLNACGSVPDGKASSIRAGASYLITSVSFRMTVKFSKGGRAFVFSREGALPNR
jgi:hypothetical protein